MYLAILTAYVLDAKRRGFRLVLIWAAPPRKREGFAFNERPEDQVLLAGDRLNIW